MKDLLLNLHNLNKLDLSSYPVKDVEKYLSNLGTSAHIGYTLHEGYDIFRARPNEDDEFSFNNRSQLSYKPQSFNTTFQRSSTPNRTMFYGSILPSEYGKDDLNNARVTSCLEASKTFRENLLLSNEKITFSRWSVNKDIKLMLVIPDVEIKNNDSFSSFMNSELSKFISMQPSLYHRTKIINKYFGDIFAKQNIKFDYDYIISALYTERVINSGFDGIIYPSVKAQGKGYNICITPECVDEKMSLIAAGECRIIKVGYHSTVVGESEVLIEDDKKSFEFIRMSSYRDPSELISEMYNEYY